MKKGKLSAEDVELEEGATINVSRRKAFMCGGVAVLTITSLSSCFLGCIFLLHGAGVVQLNNKLRIGIPVVSYCLGAFAGICGLGLMGASVFAGYKVVAMFLQGERFIVGRNSLQHVFGSKIQMHLPYDNIRELRTEKVPAGIDDGTIDILGIDLIDTMRNDTVLDQNQLKKNHGDYGWDVVIHDFYELSLKKFRGKLVKKWQASNREANRTGGWTQDHQAEK